jgi:hypothetical protein
MEAAREEMLKKTCRHEDTPRRTWKARTNCRVDAALPVAEMAKDPPLANRHIRQAEINPAVGCARSRTA